ncbi:MAG: hypothetical protein HYZ28_03700 [Myxococcales bacterium]|nr:hypothetical protein [Myxococcales bacterium]
MRRAASVAQCLEPRMRAEVERAMWIPLERAEQLLSYPGERQMVRRAVGLLAAGGGGQ